MNIIIDKEIDNVRLSYNMITRNAKNKTLVNKETTKEFKFYYDKRMVITEENGVVETLPSGY